MELRNKLFDGCIAFLRVGKRLLIRWKAHKLFGMTNTMMLYWVYYLKLSRWCELHNPENSFIASRYDLYQSIIVRENLSGPIHYLEFGVAEGSSLLYWVQHNDDPDSRFTGFDTFTGLPEDWGLTKKGTFSTNGLVPTVNDGRCSFQKGLFQDTMSDWLTSADLTKRLVIHLDADLYSSTIYVLTKLIPYLKDGDILIFDEFGFPLDEFRAFVHFIDSTGYSYEVLGITLDYWQVAMKIKAGA